MPDFTEQAELESLRRLDPQGISAIFDRYYPEVFRFVRYRLDDEHTSEDIASEVFARLLEAVKTGRGPQTNLKAWLIGTASHITTDHLRKNIANPPFPCPRPLPMEALAQR